MKIEATKGLNELLEHYTDLFWGVGYFGWHISSLYALYVTYKYSFLSFIIYIVVFILSGLSNHSLKNQLFVGSIIGFIIGYLTFLLISFIDKQSFVSYESSPTKKNSFDYQSSYNELIPFQI